MGKKSSPPPPDYAALAAQQGKDNRDTAQFNAELNRVNQVTPYGNLTWSSAIGPDGKPQWTQTIALSPQQQALEDKQNALSQQYLNTASSAVDRVAASMGQGLDLAGLPKTQYLNGPTGTSAKVNTPYFDVGSGPEMQGVSGGPNFQLQLPTAPNLPVAPTLGTASGGSIARDFDTSKVRALPGAVDDASRRRVEEAIMSRLNPQYQQDEQALRTRLLNSGIEVGTDAYNREMANFSQRMNDARMQAVLAGGQEESRQVGLQMGLQGQEFNQAYQKGKFAQDADSAMSANALQAASINNQAALGMYNAQLAAQAQKFSQGLAGATFGNTWAQQGFQNDLSAAGFNNANSQQEFQNKLTGANFANQTADTATQRQMQIDQLTSALSQQQAGFNNSALQNDIQLQAYLRQLPLNEANALRSGGQVQGPQFGQYYTANAQAAPIMDAGIAQGNYNMQQAQQNQTGFNSLLGGLANMGGAFLGTSAGAGLASKGISSFLGMFSDPRLKSDIVRVGTHPLGIGIYEYNIFGERQRGVMSTEVRQVMPEAVNVGPDGFDRVRYDLIGGV